MADEVQEPAEEVKEKTFIVDGVEVVPIKTLIDFDLANVDRITQITQIYFQHIGEDTVVADGRHSWTTETFDLEPVVRKRLRPKTSWQPLKFGDLESEDVGVVIIQNRAGVEEGLVQRDEEEKKILLQQKILVRKKNNDSMVLVFRSGVCLPLMLSDFSDLEYCCTEDVDCPASIWAFPR